MTGGGPDETDAIIVLYHSVRIMSMKTFKYGVIIADLESMPSGCSVWPAFWTLGSGKEWPYGGEIDIIEGVNNDLLLVNSNFFLLFRRRFISGFRNQYTFHTGIDQECSIPNKVPKDNAPGSFMGTIVNTDCRSSEKADTGCAVRDTSKISYGPGFDKAGGGIFALLRNKEGFKIWHFERHSIPADIRARNPNPSSWPTPNAALSVDECAGVDSFFTPQNLIFDITLCGGFGTANYQADGCPGTCAERVTKGCNYIGAYFMNFLSAMLCRYEFRCRMGDQFHNFVSLIDITFVPPFLEVWRNRTHFPILRAVA